MVVRRALIRGGIRVVRPTGFIVGGLVIGADIYKLQRGDYADRWCEPDCS